MELTNDYVQSIKKFNSNIEALLNPIDFDPENIFLSKEDPDSFFILEQSKEIIELLIDAYWKIKYLSKPIKEEGILLKNKKGRYMISQKYDYEFTSGSPIEVLIYDEWFEKEKWVITRVEHTDGDYYLYGYKKIGMQGLPARRR